MADGSGNEVLLFTKAPEAGRVKTRLMPHLSAVECARLHDALIRHAVASLPAPARWRTRIAFTPASARPYFRAFDLPLVEQGEGDLGVRMIRVLRHAFAAGAGRAVLVGTDVPSLAPRDLEAAFARLEAADIVYGPARDGGFYLVGTRAAPPGRLFAGVPWSSKDTLVRAEKQAARLGLRTARIRTRQDIDRVEDLDAARADGLPPGLAQWLRH